MTKSPILYSFRRCPYAMRARMGLYRAGIRHEHREVVLKDKPTNMLEASPKGTVPVLLLPNGQVIDESLDIMLWALNQNDPDNWLGTPKLRDDIFNLIERNDTVFKAQLDRYKYPGRYPDEEPDTLGTHARDKTASILKDCNLRLKENSALSGDEITLADIAIFPFIRQFAHVDRSWFHAQDLPHLQKWLEEHLVSPLFDHIMQKHDKWTPDSQKTYIN